MKRQRLIVVGLLLVVALALVRPSLAAPAQLPGALDTTFDPGAGTNDIVFAVATQPDGKVLIGGQFTQVNSATHNGIARLNADGSLDTTFTAGATGGTFTGLTSLALQPDGKIVIGGLFAQVNGTPRANIARLTPTGSLDTTFDPRSGVAGGVLEGK